MHASVLLVPLPLQEGAELPEKMSIQAFCAYTGMNRYHFRRFADRANLTLESVGNFKIVDVQEALVAMEAQAMKAA